MLEEVLSDDLQSTVSNGFLLIAALVILDVLRTVPYDGNISLTMSGHVFRLLHQLYYSVFVHGD